MRGQFLTTRMLARVLEREWQLPPFTLGLELSATDSRLQFQELKLGVGEFFAPGPVLLEARQPQFFFQHPDLVLGQFESILINCERAAELLEQRVRKPLFELANQLRIKCFKRGKINAQTGVLPIKNNVFFIAFSSYFIAPCQFFSIPVFAPRPPHFDPTQKQRQFFVT